MSFVAPADIFAAAKTAVSVSYSINHPLKEQTPKKTMRVDIYRATIADTVAARYSNVQPVVVLSLDKWEWGRNASS